VGLQDRSLDIIASAWFALLKLTSGKKGRIGVAGMRIVSFGLMVGLVALARPAYAATITATPTDGVPDAATVMVSGEFQDGDSERFRSAVAMYPKATVAFGSEGGNLLAGIDIGTQIRLRNYETLVPDNAVCASACAIAWLGGTKRFMGRRSHIGFHAAYRQEAGRGIESGAGNAILGAYLSKLGLPDRAIFFITQAPPDSMTWLTKEGASQQGIEVSLVDVSADEVASRGFSPPDGQDRPNYMRRGAAVTDCDRLAASPDDPSRPAGVSGIELAAIDSTKAIPACRSALSASPKDARVILQLARALLKGQMLEEAFDLCHRASEAGHAPAMSTLGVLYDEGSGTPKDEAEAVRWYRKAAEAGDLVGMTQLGLRYQEGGGGLPKDETEAVRWYRKAAEAGHAPAMGILGSVYAKGIGVPKDPAEAVRWYRKAVEAGDMVSMVGLGAMYRSGQGVLKDEAEAVRWYRKAADSGNPLGMYRLGSMYENGRGVPKDPAEAIRWYRKAALLGRKEAMAALERLAPK
jgi:TPR repeat protein